MDRQVPEHGTWSQSPKDLTPFHRSQRGAMANGGLTVTPFHPATLGTRIPSSSPATTTTLPAATRDTTLPELYSLMPSTRARHSFRTSVQYGGKVRIKSLLV